MVRVEVENAGSMSGDEVVQLYVRDMEASMPVPLQELRGFARVHLGPGERRQRTFVLKPEHLALYDLQGRHMLEPGEFEILVGGCSPAGTASGRSIPGGLSARFTVTAAG